jgi:prepilin signal peptidase PulO-like enzyme (type II secretory pathway)
MPIKTPESGQGTFRLRWVAVLGAAFTVLDVLGHASDILGLLSADYGVVYRRLVAVIGYAHLIGLPPSTIKREVWPLYLIFAMALLTITVYEWREGIIPDAVTLPAILTGVGLNVGLGIHHIGLLASVVGAAAGYFGIRAYNGICERLTGMEAFGGGVPKMVGMVGAFFGPLTLLPVVGLATWIGFFAVFIRWLIGGERMSLKSRMEFGPLVALASCICVVLPVTNWFWGRLAAM